MTKEEVFKFLNTATPEIFHEIRAHMTKIRQDRQFAEYLEKKNQKDDRNKKIIEMRLSGMAYKYIAEDFGLSEGRVYQIYKRFERRQKYEARQAEL